MDAWRDCPEEASRVAYIVSLLLSYCHIFWSGGHVVLTALMNNPHVISFAPLSVPRETSRGSGVEEEEENEEPQSIALQLQQLAKAAFGHCN